MHRAGSSVGICGRPNLSSVELGCSLKKTKVGTSMVIQRLRLCTSSAGGSGSIPGQETKILHSVQCGQQIFFKKGS